MSVSWAPAVIGVPGGPPEAAGGGGRPAVGLTYTLFAAPGGFAALGQPVVATTACGLLRWAALSNDASPPTVVANATGVALRLQANTEYEFAVMATCGPPCWAASMGAAGIGSAGLGAPGYAAQRVAYAVARNRTGNAASVPTTAGFPIAGMVGLGLAGALLAAAGVTCWRYRSQRRAADGEQYASLDLSGIDVAPSVTRSGGGFLAAVRSAVARPRGFAPVNGDAQLPESSYSELDDK